jgi:hypothetical protein
MRKDLIKDTYASDPRWGTLYTHSVIPNTSVQAATARERDTAINKLYCEMCKLYFDHVPVAVAAADRADESAGDVADDTAPLPLRLFFQQRPAQFTSVSLALRARIIYQHHVSQCAFSTFCKRLQLARASGVESLMTAPAAHRAPTDVQRCDG